MTQNNPNTNPWEKKKWRNGVIRPSGGTIIVLLLLLMATGFLGLGMFSVLYSENALKLPLNKENILLLFPFTGLCFLVSAIFTFIRNGKCHGSKFVMKTMPGIIGGRLSGVLTLNGNLDYDAKIKITLANIEYDTSPSGGAESGSQTSMRSIFEHVVSINAAQAGRNKEGYGMLGIGQIEIPFDVEIPFETKDQRDNYRSGDTKYSYKWRLNVKADIPGMDLNLKFVLPVYRTADSDPTINQAKIDAANITNALKAHQDGLFDFDDIKTTRIGDSEHYISKGRGLRLFICGLFTISVGIGMGLLDDLPMIVAGIFAMFGILLGAIGIRTMGTREVWVQDGQIKYVRHLGFTQWQRTIERDSIADIVIAEQLLNNDGNDYHADGNNYYAVNVKYSDFRPLISTDQFFDAISFQQKIEQDSKLTLEIARDIDNKAEAQLLAEKIKQQIGMTDVKK
ncbi:MAG: hypothetical protein K9M57_00410 [Phycisphaerae bacterium]|nr:hypothetical protein [Phycisphaerae bacterium]